MKEKYIKLIQENINIIIKIVCILSNNKVENIPTIYITDSFNDSAAKYIPSLDNCDYDIDESDIAYHGVEIVHNKKVGILISCIRYDSQKILFINILNDVGHEIKHYLQNTLEPDKFFTNLCDYRTVTKEKYYNNILEIEAAKFSLIFINKYCEIKNLSILQLLNKGI